MFWVQKWLDVPWMLAQQLRKEAEMCAAVERFLQKGHGNVTQLHPNVWRLVTDDGTSLELMFQPDAEYEEAGETVVNNVCTVIDMY